MDTGTVMTIIAMFDARIENIIKQEEIDDARGEEMLWYTGGVEALKDFKDYLQEYIHSLQNQVENDMNRGE